MYKTGGSPKLVDYYNTNYLHSAPGYRNPVQVEVEYYRNHDLRLNRRLTEGSKQYKGSSTLSYNSYCADNGHVIINIKSSA